MLAGGSLGIFCNPTASFRRVISRCFGEHRAFCRSGFRSSCPRPSPFTIAFINKVFDMRLQLPYNWAHRGLLPSAVRRARRILVVSRFVADEVMRYFRVPAFKIEVTPLGVRREFFSAKDGDTGAEHGPNKLTQLQATVLATHKISTPFVLGVGTLEARKNLKTLLEAFALLPSRLTSQFQLVLAGKPGWGATNLEKFLQNYERRSSLVLTGYVSAGDLRALYSSAEMFVFPSFYEGFGLPVAEALASGCPVIASTALSLKKLRDRRRFSSIRRARRKSGAGPWFALPNRQSSGILLPLPGGSGLAGFPGKPVLNRLPKFSEVLPRAEHEKTAVLPD